MFIKNSDIFNDLYSALPSARGVAPFTIQARVVRSAGEELITRPPAVRYVLTAIKSILFELKIDWNTNRPILARCPWSPQGAFGNPQSIEWFVRNDGLPLRPSMSAEGRFLQGIKFTQPLAVLFN